VMAEFSVCHAGVVTERHSSSSPTQYKVKRKPPSLYAIALHVDLFIP
jgi:hypothetical protein